MWFISFQTFESCHVWFFDDEIAFDFAYEKIGEEWGIDDYGKVGDRTPFGSVDGFKTEWKEFMESYY